MGKRALRWAVLFFWLLFPSSFVLPKAAFAAITNHYFHVGSTTYTVNGQDYTMDVAPFIENGRVYLPVRYMAYALGIPDSGIMWDSSTQTVALKNGTNVVAMTIGSTTLTVDGAAQTMDVPPVITSGRVMLPVRWVANAFDVGTSWFPDTQTVNIITEDSGTLTVTTPTSQPTTQPQPTPQQATPVPQAIPIPLPPTLPTPITGITTENYSWSADGYSDSWSVNIPNALLQYDDWLASVWQWYGSLPGSDLQAAYQLLPDTLKNWLVANTSTDSDLVPLVTDSLNYQFEGTLASSMAKTFSTNGINQVQEVDLVAGLVQSLPYNEPQELQLAGTTLVKGGDCKAKSELLAGLLKQLGFQVVLLSYPANEFPNNVGHVAVGVSVTPTSMTAGGFYYNYNYNGVNYYYLESTDPNWHLGQMPNGRNVSPQVDLTNKKAYIYPVQ